MKAYLQILFTILAAALSAVVVLAALLIGAYYYVEPGLPEAAELRDIRIQVPLQVYSRDGRLIDEFGEMKRTPVAYADVPPLLIKAVLATEDEHFFEHPGIDYRGVIRGFIAELGIGPEVGGSTITQQVPRTLEVMKRAGLNSGFDRIVAKYKEWILAYRMEQEFTKEEILELYLNTSFFGQRSYGIATAAQTYFGKSLGELSISETAILAGIPQRPTQWNPVYSIELATTRRAYVLRRMRETGAINDEQHEAALAEPLEGREFGLQRQLEAPYVAEMVRAEMVRRFGSRRDDGRAQSDDDDRQPFASGVQSGDTRHVEGVRRASRLPRAVGACGDSGRRSGRCRTGAAERARRRGSSSVARRVSRSPRLRDGARARGGRRRRAPVLRGPRRPGDRSRCRRVGGAVRHRRLDGPETDNGRRRAATRRLVRFRRTAEGGWRLAQIPEAQGAFVSVDPLDGAVVALNGGFNFFLNSFNRATQAERQPGSSFKPFVYSAAFENGFTPATIVLDAPPDVGYQASLERVWRPENFGGKYFGYVRLREALYESMNSVSIRILQSMGMPAAISHVKRFGFNDVAVPNDLSLALGAGGVPPLSVAAGYAVFANGGYKVTPYFIDRVVTADGEVLYETKPLLCPECNTPPETPAQLEPAEPELVSDITELYPKQRAAPRAISPQNAYLVSDLLHGVVANGTANLARRELGRNDLAGKTGTTNEGRDTWFVGFNANIVGAAWVGFDSNRPLGVSEQGARTALPMWIAFMREALGSTPERRPRRPPGIVEYRINPTTGLIASDGAPNTIFEKFDIDHLPEREEGGFSNSPTSRSIRTRESQPAGNPFLE